MALTDRQKDKFYRNKQRVNKIIVRNVKRRGHVIYGAQAINIQLPQHLRTPTEDYDVYTKTPKKTARRVERRLDRTFGGDFFFTEPATHPRTTRLKSHVTKRVVADYTKPTGKIPVKVKKGVKYVPIKHIKKGIKKTLKDPKSHFRHAKDREALQRIRLHEKRKAKRKPRKRRPAVFANIKLPSIRF